MSFRKSKFNIYIFLKTKDSSFCYIFDRKRGAKEIHIEIEHDINSANIASIEYSYFSSVDFTVKKVQSIVDHRVERFLREEFRALSDRRGSSGRSIAGNQKRVGEIFRERENKTFAWNILSERVITAGITVNALASTGARKLAGREFSAGILQFFPFELQKKIADQNSWRALEKKSNTISLSKISGQKFI